jgi:hypothetical protein
LGYPPDTVLSVPGRSVPALRCYLRGIDGGNVTLQTHQNGIPFDVRKFTLYQRKNLFAKMCDGKKQFFTEKSATIAMNYILDMGLEMDKNLSVYVCPFCGWWHFGHRPWDVEKLIGDVE